MFVPAQLFFHSLSALVSRLPCSCYMRISGQFIYVIRKRIKLDPEKAIFIFVNDTIPQTCKRSRVVYRVWFALVPVHIGSLSRFLRERLLFHGYLC